MTVRTALDAKRKALKGKVSQLVLCKGELFYLVDDKWLEDTVYPVGQKTAAKEAKFFKVAWSEE